MADSGVDGGGRDGRTMQAPTRPALFVPAAIGVLM